MNRLTCRSLPALGAFLLLGCVTTENYDYTAYLEHPPLSILVLPPLDETVEMEACYGSLSIITRPLAERGFYVFPVAVVDAMMRDNGLPTPYEMHQVPLEKLREVFDPDAVLYLTVTDWGTSYQVLASNTTVTIEAVLVDAVTGNEIWHGSQTAVEGSGDGGGGLAGLIAAALVNQVATSISDPSRMLASKSAWGLFSNSGSGLLPGPYHKDHEAGLQAAQANLAPENE